jgi:heme/copper-type cytochrome/quinol oxidase subunit 1
MFFILGLLLIIPAFLFTGGAYEIQLYDTYFIISWANIFGYLGLFCCLIEGLYFWLNRNGKFSRKWYKWVHAVTTVLSIGLLYFSQAELLAMSGINRRYVSLSNAETAYRSVNLGAIAITLFASVQVVFFVGVLVSFLRSQRTA